VGASGHAATVSVTVDGTDAVLLAGRTDLAVPDATEPWPGPGDRLLRHDGPTPEAIASPAAASEQALPLHFGCRRRHRPRDRPGGRLVFALCGLSPRRRSALDRQAAGQDDGPDHASAASCVARNAPRERRFTE
jgi:hypothetical protein